MNVLVGFEESGTVREAFRLRGHNAWSCDLQPARDGSPYHLQCDIWEAFMIRHPDIPSSAEKERHNKSPWDLIILHPECTALTVAGNHVYAFGKPKHIERLKALSVTGCYWRFATEICDKVCMENPQGVLHTNLPWLPKPQYIQPYYFGEDASKKTGLTLHNLPRLIPTERVQGRIANGVERWSNQTDSGQNRLGPSPTRARDRAKTYQGIADAMAEQ